MNNRGVRRNLTGWVPAASLDSLSSRFIVSWNSSELAQVGCSQQQLGSGAGSAEVRVNQSCKSWLIIADESERLCDCMVDGIR